VVSALRFVRPPDVWLGIAALVCALIAAGFGAALGGRMSWRGGGPPPTKDEAAAIVSAALPDQHVADVYRYDREVGLDRSADDGFDRWLVPLLGDDGYDPGFVRVTFNPVADPAASIRRARSALSSAGWDVASLATDAHGTSFTAVKGDLRLSWGIANTVGDNGVLPDRYNPVVTAEVQRDESKSATAGVLLGWLVGLVLGWAVAVPLTRRLRSAAAIRQNLAVGSFVLSVVTLTWPTALTTLGVFEAAVAGDPTTTPWFAYTVFGLQPLTIVGVFGLLALLLLGLGRPRSAPNSPSIVDRELGAPSARRST